MSEVAEKIETIRDIGDAVTKVLEIGFEPAKFGCPVEGGPESLLEDERYSQSLNDMKSVLSDFGEVEVDDEFFSESEPFLSIRSTKYVNYNRFSTIHVNYAADGTGVVTAEFQIEESWFTAVDHHVEELSTADIGRFVARAELLLLAHEFESPTETLDYWITEGCDFQEGGLRQSRWADLRGVSRQSVSDRVRSAKKKLDSVSDEE